MLLAALLALVCWASASTVNATTDDECVRAAPHQFSREQARLLCHRASSHELGDGPAKCASAVLKGAFISSLRDDAFAADVAELCQLSPSNGPKPHLDCWMTVPTHMHRSVEWRRASVSVCKQAGSTTPARCLLEFKRHGLTAAGSHGRQSQPMNAAVQVCKAFQGEVYGIGTCLQRAPRSLREAERYLLCRQANSSSVEDVVSCARHLQRRSVPTAIVVHVCAVARKGESSPEECVVAAQQQLRWMDHDAIAQLCVNSLSSMPVQCANTLRSWYASEFKQRDGRVLSYDGLTQLCHRPQDAEAIERCVRKLPSKLFTPEQVVRLCASPTSSVKAECIAIATRQLFALGGTVETRLQNQAALLLTICEDAASFAPTDCVLESSQSLWRQSLTPPSLARLCGGTTSACPQQCLRTIQPTVVQRLPNGIADAIELCQRCESPAPAHCINTIGQHSLPLIPSGMATRLCAGARSSAPAACYYSAPQYVSDADKVTLCAQAVSDAPVACAKVSLPRIKADSDKVKLCTRSQSTAPATCASASPYGMDVDDIITLCAQATDDRPANCARVAPPHLRIPWQDMAAVCRNATSTTPGSCLVHRVRQRQPITPDVIRECRQLTAQPASLEIAQFAYECEELLPHCPVSVIVRILDQFNDEIPSLSSGYVHLEATVDAMDERDSDFTSPVRGVTVVPIVNGTAQFRGIEFAIAGNYTIRLRSTGADALIARLHVRSNETERRRIDACNHIFSLMECQFDWKQSAESDATQTLALQYRYVLGGGLACESMWEAQHAGPLRPFASTMRARLYAVPELSYRLLIGHSIPSPGMSAWECLGVDVGANRSAIRKAFHQRSLEWHPDKWARLGRVNASSSFERMRRRVEVVYDLINRAYEELSKEVSLP